MTSFCAGGKCILFIDYLVNGLSINGEYYAELLRQLRKSLKNKHLESPWFQRLPYTALNRLINLSIFFIWLHLTINYYSTRQKHVDGNGHRSDNDVITEGDDFFTKRVEASLPTGSKHCSTEVCGRKVHCVDKINLIWSYSMSFSWSATELFR